MFVKEVLESSNIDIDYEFLTESHVKNFSKEISRLVSKFQQELNDVKKESSGVRPDRARLTVLEIMCSSESELTKQTIRVGGRAKRFGLHEGDLSTRVGRKGLFQCLVRENPENCWISPECKYWCQWSAFNGSRSIEAYEQLYQDRFQNLWQIALALVIFRYQHSRGRHFHLEQPGGSEMLKMPAIIEIQRNTEDCTFDLCKVADLKHPQTQEYLRKRLTVLSTSRTFIQALSGHRCDNTHVHGRIEGTVNIKGKRMGVAQFTENYPVKFAKQIAKLLVHGNKGTTPIYQEALAESSEHPKNPGDSLRNTVQKRLSACSRITAGNEQWPRQTGWLLVLALCWLIKVFCWKLFKHSAHNMSSNTWFYVVVLIGTLVHANPYPKEKLP